MTSISLPYVSDIENLTILENLRRQYSNVVRFSYNRFKEGKTQKDIRLLTHMLKNIDDLNAWFIQCAIKEAESIYKTNGENNVIFGGKNIFHKRFKKLVSNSDVKEKRLLPIMFQGECLKKGNRSFKLNIINNNKIILKVSKDKHLSIKLPKLRNNYKKLLFQLERLNDISQRKIGLTYSVRIDSNHINITVETPAIKNELLNNRYIGIDLNPNNIGVSIKEDEKILEVKHFLLKTKEHNKTEYEIYEISKKIEKLFKKWNCKYVFVEDLTIKSKEHKKGKIFNRLINGWIRNKFITNLEKRINSLGGKLFKVNPVYSSIIGNCMYEYSDPINASLEIARRGYEIIILKNKQFYPTFWLKESLKHLWKEMVNDIPDNWKDLFVFIKNLKLKYRVSLNEQFNVLSQLSLNSKVFYFSYPI
jgi:IS605 OrfB family transposase